MCIMIYEYECVCVLTFNVTNVHRSNLVAKYKSAHEMMLLKIGKQLNHAEKISETIGRVKTKPAAGKQNRNIYTTYKWFARCVAIWLIRKYNYGGSLRFIGKTKHLYG